MILGAFGGIGGGHNTTEVVEKNIVVFGDDNTFWIIHLEDEVGFGTLDEKSLNLVMDFIFDVFARLEIKVKDSGMK